MNDFEGWFFNAVYVHNHCAPTAGVNLVKYWAKRRGVNQFMV